MKKALLLFSLFVLFCNQTYAQVVEKINGNMVLISAGTLQLKANDDLNTFDKDARKTGTIKITQVKGNRAVGLITAGSVVPGATLVPNKTPPPQNLKKTQQSVSMETASSSFSGPKKSIGLLVGYGIDAISFLAADSFSPPLHTETASMSGSSFSIKGFYDRPYSNSIVLRFGAGIDGFGGNYTAQNVTINTDASTASKVSLMTLAFDGEAMWNYYDKSRNTAWLSGGYSFQYAISSSSNMYSLKTSTPYSNIVFGGAGANFSMSPDTFLPIFFHYNYYIAGAGITQSSITFGAGWGWSL